MVKLKDIVSITKGKKHQEVEISINANRYIQIADLSSDESLKYTVEKGVEVDKNDLIIAWDGANAGKVGYNLDGIIGSTLARLRILNSNILPSYLFRFLDSQFENIKSKRTGATIPHVNGAELRNLPIPLPPLPQGRRIAEFHQVSGGLPPSSLVRAVSITFSL